MRLSGQLQAFCAVYLRGLIILKMRAIKNLISFLLSPALYALAFGWGIGKDLTVEGMPYLTFMIPGLIALSGMTQSFSIATEVNISRFLTHFFEEYLLSPALGLTIVLGNILYGMTKGLCSFMAVLLIGLVFGAVPNGTIAIILPVLLNSFMFAALGLWIALSVKTHRDMTSFQSFVITPMSFIAGTFFSLESLPGIFKVLTELIPLTHSSITIRAAFLGEQVATYHYVVLIAYALFFLLMAVRRLRKAVS